MIEIGPLGGIRNFGWLHAGRLARSEQPPLDDNTLETLAAAGIQTVMSLRTEAERAGLSNPGERHSAGKHARSGRLPLVRLAHPASWSDDFTADPRSARDRRRPRIHVILR